MSGRRPQLLRGTSFANLMPSQVASFIFSKTGLSGLRRRRRSLIYTQASCRALGNDFDDDENAIIDHTENTITEVEEEQEDGYSFEPTAQLSLLQAKSVMSQVERELNKQKSAKDEVIKRCVEDYTVADARRLSGCRRGFLLSVRKMKKHQRDAEVFAQAIQCLETLLLVISTEVNQVEAIANLTGQAPASLKLFLTAESLRDEIHSILMTDSTCYNGNDEDDELFREMRNMVAPLE